LKDLDFFPEELRERYDPRRQLGFGTMGRVYLAVDRKRKRLVAVKVLSHYADDHVAERLEREALVMAKVRHPNVLRVYGAGRTSQGPYVVTEYLRGMTLAEVEGEQDVEGIGIQIADGLGAVHEADLLHRDVKPDNVFATNKGRVVLVDFGLAFDPELSGLTATGGMIGTLHYMAPEVLAGERATAASDWYSWGATLYRLAEGDVPFPRGEILKALAKSATLDVDFEKLDPESKLARLLRRALSWEPSLRPETAAEVRGALGAKV
jgi:serine/threonine protein kinase